jgi:hypothetical protein
MGFPLPAAHKKGEGVCYLTADEINTIENMLNGLSAEMIQNQNEAVVVPPGQDGKGWKIQIPTYTPNVAIPAAPASGDYVLTSQGGVLSWVALETFTCPEGT